ncbi:hypothetical protein AC1031_019578 [Aphanomyces cochlioides]|nr:hypothetical protein AC1031_019578 [Aphanomyces cochlioides]
MRSAMPLDHSCSSGSGERTSRRPSCANGSRMATRQVRQRDLLQRQTCLTTTPRRRDHDDERRERRECVCQACRSCSCVKPVDDLLTWARQFPYIAKFIWNDVTLRDLFDDGKCVNGTTLNQALFQGLAKSDAESLYRLIGISNEFNRNTDPNDNSQVIDRPRIDLVDGFRDGRRCSCMVDIHSACRDIHQQDVAP